MLHSAFTTQRLERAESTGTIRSAMTSFDPPVSSLSEARPSRHAPSPAIGGEGRGATARAHPGLTRLERAEPTKGDPFSFPPSVRLCRSSATATIPRSVRSCRSSATADSLRPCRAPATGRSARSCRAPATAIACLSLGAKPRIPCGARPPKEDEPEDCRSIPALAGGSHLGSSAALHLPGRPSLSFRGERSDHLKAGRRRNGTFVQTGGERPSLASDLAGSARPLSGVVFAYWFIRFAFQSSRATARPDQALSGRFMATVGSN